MKKHHWSHVILGLWSMLLVACLPISNDEDRTAVTPDTITTAIPAPIIAQQRATEPAATRNRATSPPPAKPTSRPTAMPTISAPANWRWLGGEAMGLQLAIPPTWLDLSTQLDTAEANELLGLTALYVVDSMVTGESLMADKPINQGAFLTASLAKIPLNGTTMEQQLQSLLNQLSERVTPINGAEITAVTAVAPTTLIQGVATNVAGHPLRLFETSGPNLTTRILLFPTPNDPNTYAIFLLSATTAQWRSYQPIFEQMIATIVVYEAKSDFTVAGGQAHLVGELTGETAVNVSLSQDVRDIWSFTADDARYATVSLSPDDANLDLKLTIVAPTGEVVASIDNGYGGDAEVAADILLQNAGQYLVEVREFQGSAGWYTLQLTLSDTPQFNGNGQIQLGQTVQSELPENEQHFWMFDGVAGQEISIVLAPQHEQFDAILDLYSPDGERLLALDEGFSGDAEIISGFILPLTGSYTILIRNFTNEGGAYAISLNEGKEETQNFYEAGDLFYGQTRQESIRKLEAHAWYFTGKAGDEVTIDVTPFSDQLDLEVWLFDPTLERIVIQDKTSVGAPEGFGITLPVEGEYVILVRDFNGIAGNYNITLQAMPVPAPTYAGILRYGEPVSTTIAANQQVVWLFTATEGEVVDLTLTPANSSSDLIMVLEDLEGNTLQQIDDNPAGQAEAVQNFVIPADGDWRVVVKTFLDAGGNYILLVKRSGQ